MEIEDALPTEERGLHKRMANMSLRRSKNVSIRARTKWALYEKEHFDTLVNNLQNLVDLWEKLFPAKTAAQKSCAMKRRRSCTVNPHYLS